MMFKCVYTDLKVTFLSYVVAPGSSVKMGILFQGLFLVIEQMGSSKIDQVHIQELQITMVFEAAYREAPVIQLGLTPSNNTDFNFISRLITFFIIITKEVLPDNPWIYTLLRI